MEGKYINQSDFYILLVLGIHKSHGYEIMKKSEIYSNGKIKLGPGTLYTAIKRLLDDNLINETFEDENKDPRRRYYEITEKGSRILSSELERYRQAINLAEEFNIFNLL